MSPPVARHVSMWATEGWHRTTGHRRYLDRELTKDPGVPLFHILSAGPSSYPCCPETHLAPGVLVWPLSWYSLPSCIPLR